MLLINVAQTITFENLSDLLKVLHAMHTMHILGTCTLERA